MNNRRLFLAITLAMFPLGDVTAQQATSDDQKVAEIVSGVAVLEGPYELLGGGGVVGYVLSRAGDKANFQPCTGKVKMVDSSDLMPSPLYCKDEAPKKTPVFNLACNDVESQVAEVTAKVGQDISKVDVGTVFLKAAEGYSQAIAPPKDSTWVQWNNASVAPYSVCGQKYVVLPKVGFDQAWIGVIKAPSQ
ncbi:hypothetical protein ACWGTI_19370 [Mesorhizobium sp. ArgA1]